MTDNVLNEAGLEAEKEFRALVGTFPESNATVWERFAYIHVWLPLFHGRSLGEDLSDIYVDAMSYLTGNNLAGAVELAGLEGRFWPFLHNKGLCSKGAAYVGYEAACVWRRDLIAKHNLSKPRRRGKKGGILAPSHEFWPETNTRTLN